MSVVVGRYFGSKAPQGSSYFILRLKQFQAVTESAAAVIGHFPVVRLRKGALLSLAV